MSVKLNNNIGSIMLNSKEITDIMLNSEKYFSSVAWVIINGPRQTLTSVSWDSSGYVPSRSVTYYFTAETKPVKKIHGSAHVQNHVNSENATVRLRIQGRKDGSWINLLTTSYAGSGTNAAGSLTYKTGDYTFATDAQSEGYDAIRAYSEGNSFRRGVGLYLDQWLEQQGAIVDHTGNYFGDILSDSDWAAHGFSRTLHSWSNWSTLWNETLFHYIFSNAHNPFESGNSGSEESHISLYIDFPEEIIPKELKLKAIGNQNGGHVPTKYSFRFYNTNTGYFTDKVTWDNMAGNAFVWKTYDLSSYTEKVNRLWIWMDETTWWSNARMDAVELTKWQTVVE